MPLSPTSASVAIGGSQAFTSSGVTSPKWDLPEGPGSLSGVSGSNATYDAPGSAALAVIRAAEEFWENIYDNSGTSNSDNSITGSNTTRAIGYARAAANGLSLRWKLPTGFTAVATNSIGFFEFLSSASFRFCGDGQFKVNGVAEGATATIADGDTVELKFEDVSGSNKLRVYVNGTLAITSTTTISHGFYKRPELRFGAGTSSATWKAPRLIGAWTNLVFLEAEIDVTAPLDALFTLGSTSYNYGQAVIATDGSTGGAGTKTRVWKIDGVVTTPSNGSFTSPTFAGLSAGTHTIRLEVTDDSGSDFFEDTVFIGTVSGSSAVANGAASTYTTNVSTPTWSVTAGDGSINSGGVFTAPESGNGESTIRAINGENFTTKTIIWGFPRTVTLSNVESYNSTGLPDGQGFRARVRARDAAGNWSEWSAWEEAETT